MQNTEITTNTPSVDGLLVIGDVHGKVNDYWKLATISGVVFKRKPTYLPFIENKDEWLIEIQARPDTYYDYRILL